MKNILLLIPLLFVLLSCDNINTEKDKYPDIPDFPKFKNNIFNTENITNIELQPLSRFKKTIENEFILQYAVKDSSLYLITYYNDDDFPNEAFLDYKYYLTLVKITNGKVVKKKNWVDSDFAFNFWLKPNNDIIIGNRFFSNKNDYQTSEKIDSLKIDSLKFINFNKFNNQLVDNEDKIMEINKNNNFNKFDEIVIDSKFALKGAGRNRYYLPVYLSYYELNFKNKKALTKVDHRLLENTPILISTNKNFMYSIIYNEEYLYDSKMKKQYIINQLK